MVGHTSNKRQLKRQLAQLKRLRTWQLIVLLLLVSLIAASLLRLNNLGMVERREAVYAADEAGEEKAIKNALVDLQHYVSSHMNTDLGNGVYLVKSYERDRAAALKAAGDTSNPNSAVYQQASIDCRSRFVGGVESFRNDYVQCVIERVSALQEQDEDAFRLDLPQAERYRYDFASPAWSPDPAGIAVALAALISLIIVIRVAAAAALRMMLRRHYRMI